MRTKDNLTISLRIRYSVDSKVGPGKIALLEAVARNGSIAAAGREMAMSYRRAWLLIDSLNQMFDAPVVNAESGGAQGGGATLTALGHSLVAAYRAVERDTAEAVARHFAALEPHIRADRPEKPARADPGKLP